MSRDTSSGTDSCHFQTIVRVASGHVSQQRLKSRDGFLTVMLLNGNKAKFIIMHNQALRYRNECRNRGKNSTHS